MAKTKTKTNPVLLPEERKEECVFAGIKEETAKKPDEKMYTCKHGKTLSWKTARIALGLEVKG